MLPAALAPYRAFRVGVVADAVAAAWTRWRELAAVCGGAALLAVGLTYPLAARMGHVGRVDSADGQFSIWNVAWVARTLVVDPLHVFDANIFYPHRWTLAYSENNLGAGLLAIPAYWATRNPYFALNFAILLSFVLSAAAMYALVRYLTEDRRAAAIAAICFAFCPYVFSKTAEIQLMMIAGLPLALLAFHRAADRPTLGRGAALGAAMAAEAICCGYYGVFLIPMIGFATAVIATTRRYWRDPRYWTCLACAAAVAIAIVLPLFLPYVYLHRVHGFSRPLVEARVYAADWRGYLASSAWAHVWMLTWLGHWRGAGFPGFVATAFGMAGLWRAWRSPGREVLVLYGGLAILGVWASFGPDAGLYTLLYKTVPLFAWLRAPERFAIIPTLALSVLTGVTLTRLFARVRRPQLVAVLIGGVAAVELATPLPMSAAPPVPRVYQALRRLPPGGVLEVPFTYQPEQFYKASAYMLASTTHWMPLVNGYSDYIPPAYARDAIAMGLFPSRAGFKAVARRHVRYVVFHLQTFDGPSRARLFGWIAAAGSRLRLIYEDEETRLYEIVPRHRAGCKRRPPREPRQSTRRVQ